MVDTAVKFGILPHITFNTTIVEAEWREEEGRWRSLTSSGEEFFSQAGRKCLHFTSKYLFTAGVGPRHWDAPPPCLPSA